MPALRNHVRVVMRISVFGLGYVGTVSAACLASEGHYVIGVDPNPLKVDPVNQGTSPLIEPGLEALIHGAVAAGRLTATADHAAAIARSEISFVAVGTPSGARGHVDLSHLERCLASIGTSLRAKAARHLVVVRSTVPPGTTRERLVPWLEETSGKRVGCAIGLCYQPEFLREGQAIEDYRSPTRTVIAASDDQSFAELAALYAPLDAPIIQTGFTVAELVKYVDNAWHALKVGFANEVGSLARALDVDGREVMAIFRRDQKLNLSGAYLQPGFAFGGSCLPKDLRALTHAGRALDLELPVLNAVLPSNRQHLERVLARITGQRARRIGVLGLSFKRGTDDLRESPMVELIERLIGKGYAVRVFDEVVNPERMIGANRAYALAHLPHVAKLLDARIEAVIDHAELLLIGHIDPALLPIVVARAKGRRVIDCAGLDGALSDLARYEGVCW